MEEQEVALVEIFRPVGRCLLTLLSKKTKVASLFSSGWKSKHVPPQHELLFRLTYSDLLLHVVP